MKKKVCIAILTVAVLGVVMGITYLVHSMNIRDISGANYASSYSYYYLERD